MGQIGTFPGKSEHPPGQIGTLLYFKKQMVVTLMSWFLNLLATII